MTESAEEPKLETEKVEEKAEEKPTRRRRKGFGSELTLDD